MVQRISRAPKVPRFVIPRQTLPKFKFITRVQIFFTSFQARYKKNRDFSLTQTLSFIRTSVRRALRKRPGASRPGSPPHAHTRGGLREINYDQRGNEGVVGPRKFRGSRFFNRPVPNIQEVGGVAVASTFRQRIIANYPERSYMWSTVKKLQRGGRISRKFSISLARF